MFTHIFRCCDRASNDRLRLGPGGVLHRFLQRIPLAPRPTVRSLTLKRVIIIIEFETAAETEHTDHYQDEQAPYWADEMQDMLDDYN
jgi:hypothetical protein